MARYSVKYRRKGSTSVQGTNVTAESEHQAEQQVRSRTGNHDVEIISVVKIG